MSDPTSQPEEITRSQKAFIDAPEPIQRLIRQVLSEERQVIHLSSRVGQNIHQKILEQVKGIIR